MPQKPSLQINLHFPFCQKTGNLYPKPCLERVELQHRNDYLKALRREIAAVAEDTKDYEITQVNLGGGPLNLADCTQWQLVLRDIKKHCDIKQAQLTLRISPDGFGRDDYYRFYSESGNWLLVDMVSHVTEELTAAGAPHLPRDNTALFLLLSDFRCKNFDLRLFYGLPGQTEESLVVSLDRAVRMYGRHISLLPWNGDMPGADAARLYAKGRAFLTEAGYEEYIPGRFGKEGARIRLYEETPAEWMGLGLGAVSQMDGMRFCNIDDLAAYIQYADRYDLICRRLDD